MKKLLVAVLAATLAAPALAAVDAAALFSAKCAACHGKDGKGSPVGKKMGAKDLSNESKEPEQELVKDIANGKGKMPSFKAKLSADEISALAKYIKGGLK
jgi:mono/diheme cytochrome c family protein